MEETPEIIYKEYIDHFNTYGICVILSPGCKILKGLLYKKYNVQIFDITIPILLQTNIAVNDGEISVVGCPNDIQGIDRFMGGSKFDINVRDKSYIHKLINDSEWKVYLQDRWTKISDTIKETNITFNTVVFINDKRLCSMTQSIQNGNTLDHKHMVFIHDSRFYSYDDLNLDNIKHITSWSEASICGNILLETDDGDKDYMIFVGLKMGG